MTRALILKGKKMGTKVLKGIEQLSLRAFGGVVRLTRQKFFEMFRRLHHNNILVTVVYYEVRVFWEYSWRLAWWIPVETILNKCGILTRKPLENLSGFKYDFNRGRHFDRKAR